MPISRSGMIWSDTWGEMQESGGAALAGPIKIERIVRYLGIEVDGAIEIAEEIDI